ncbi:Cytochrome P450 2W1 [Pteropus alecto]|uniref:Cytochrome P450 2W1 n=1 Tax=Pteropus alecto TaxID=9402 RepID=L5KFD0_PTEAL|nr:Cytochrome P450 2W1 [Pteropus alecto]
MVGPGRTVGMALLVLVLVLGLVGLAGLWALLHTGPRALCQASCWPPGPRPLPLIGNLLLLQLHKENSLMELSERYGQVFTIHWGRQKMVVLCGYEAVREALVGTRPKLAIRPFNAIFQLIQKGRGSCSPVDWPAGIFSISGPPWKASHQFTVRALHDLGVGRRPAADKVLQELIYLLGQLDHYGGRPFPVALLGCAASNITLTVLFGQRFDYNDPVFVALLELIGEVTLHLATVRVQLYNIMPRLGALLQLQRPIMRKVAELRAILRTLLEARRAPAAEEGPAHSYVEALIRQVHVWAGHTPSAAPQRPQRPGPHSRRAPAEADPDGQFDEDDVMACVLDMVLAGTETTMITIQWAILLMVKHQSVQGERAGRATVLSQGAAGWPLPPKGQVPPGPGDPGSPGHCCPPSARRQGAGGAGPVLGHSRPPQMEDLPSLPYTNAVLHEVQRFISVLPRTSRSLTTDTRLSGYLFPKGTDVILLLNSELRDKTQWETPHQFNPGHFLDAEGRFVKREAFMAFSAGRRVCVGEHLARTQVFLLFAGLLQRFHLLPPPGLSPASLDIQIIPAIFKRPFVQGLCAVPRP